MNPTGGLPDAAVRRLEAQRVSGTSSSLLSAPAAASLSTAGMVPVGEVFGCLVMHIGFNGTGCPSYYSAPSTSRGGYRYATPVVTSSSGTYTGFAPYVKAYEHGWFGAMNRLRQEALALGAHGVVGIVIEQRTVSHDTIEFTALGTAVRSQDPIRAPFPPAGHVWCTTLTAEDTAAAVLSGYLPRDVVMGVSVASKHPDQQMQRQDQSWSNVEVTGLTELITAARADARRKLEHSARQLGGGAVVVTGMHLDHFETSCADEPDRHARSVFLGTTLVPVPRIADHTDTSRVTTVVPLNDLAARVRRG